MADLKISQMTDGGTIQTTDKLPVVRSGANRKVNVGSAATRNTGTGVDQIPLFQDFGDLAFQDDITLADITISAQFRVLGRNSSGAGPAEEVTFSQFLDWVGGSPARGDILFRGAAGWQKLTSGTANMMLQTNGVADPTWSFIATNNVSNNAITYAKMQDISATARILGRKTAGAGDPEECTLSDILDFVGSAAQGDILYRNGSGWTRLGASTSGYVLKTNGPAANPAWADPNGLVTQPAIDNSIQDFRLTLTSGVPVTTADVTGASAQTIYACPYKGNRIALYTGSAWVMRTTAQFSLALGTLTATRPYDVFCYDNAGTPTLEFLAWTSGTARATGLAYQDGVLVKSGDATRRYLGTFCTVNTTQTADSLANRYLWNYYHRVKRPMAKAETTASWSYSTGSFRQANGSTANQLNFVIGVAEDSIEAQSTAQATNSTTTQRAIMAGIGLNSTTVNAAQIYYKGLATSTIFTPSMALYSGVPAIGVNFLAWLEAGTGADTQTFISNSTTSGGLNGSNGIVGAVMA